MTAAIDGDERSGAGPSQPRGDALVAAVCAALAAHGLGAADAIAVACSGGPDSSALAHACMALARRGALGAVQLFYVDHGLRDDSRTDAAVVQALAAAGEGRAMVRRVEVSRAQASLEAAARDARYQALAEMADAAGIDWVLLAHTASDQAETVLMRILRGTGVTGLASIPARRGRYLRPLLHVTRAEVEAYVAEHGLACVADEMNRDPGFLRVRVRHQWLPALRAENPRIDEALCRLAESARQQREVLEYAAAELLERCVGAGTEEGWLAVAPLGAAPSAVRRRALAVAAEAGGLAPLEARHLVALEQLVGRARAGTVELSLPGGRAVRRYDELRFAVRAADGGADEADGEPAPLIVNGPDGPYHIRRWQPGDRMRPARLKGRSRKLSDLFADARVPRAQRPLARVVVRTRDGVIVWAEHIGPAHGAAVSVALTPREPVASNEVLE